MEIVDITEFKENVLNISAPNNMAYQLQQKLVKIQEETNNFTNLEGFSLLISKVTKWNWQKEKKREGYKE